MGDFSFQAIAEKARDYAIPRGRRFLSLLHHGAATPHISWQVNADQVVFLVDHSARVSARFQLIGFQWWKKDLWQWAWSVPDLDSAIVRDAEVTRAFGTEHGIRELTTPELPVVDQLPTDLAAIAAMVCMGDAAWPLPLRKGVFDLVVLHDMRLVTGASA